ncbi:hypothetical protein P171DRAFT_286636 [Karstenula rhodostoma CBS 690.94]|uniref:Uncharacterized protein n=1 Tax=Karstenula rhodostoma CBS 690.94 TaxID=1392251 RepID=A0A9P4PH35_9PLEO|nr:hypothetical protein P171DRAFT_286636 [Karstenula rhodostoma CBS 690.94]
MARLRRLVACMSLYLDPCSNTLECQWLWSNLITREHHDTSISQLARVSAASRRLSCSQRRLTSRPLARIKNLPAMASFEQCMFTADGDMPASSAPRSPSPYCTCAKSPWSQM